MDSFSPEYSGQDYYIESAELRAKKDAAVDELRQLGIAAAEDDVAYRVAKTNRVLTLKAEGMSATMIQMIIEGESAVAPLRLQKLKSDAMYKACQEYINSLKIDLNIIKEQIGHELGRAGN